MANDGQISVNLKLLIDEAIKQAKTAAVALNKELGIKQPDMSKAASNTNKAADAQKKHGDEVRRTNRALTEQQQRLKDIASGKILGPVQAGQQINIATGGATSKTYGPGATIPGGNTGQGLGTAAKIPQQPGPFVPNPMNNMLRRQLLLQPQMPAGMPTLPNAPTPAPAMKSLAPMLAAALGTGIGGPLGGAIAGVLTKLNPAVAAVTAAMSLLRLAAQETAKAFENARAIYAKSAGSGFGVRQTVQRGALASAIGVSEAEIYQYGAAIEQLNGKLEPAIRTITEANGPLTAVAWNFSVLETNLKALWATVAEAVAPAINRLLELVSALVKLYTLSGMASAVGYFFNILIESVTRLVALGSVVWAGMALVGTAIMDAFKSIVAQIQNYLAGTKIGQALGMSKTEDKGFKNTKDAYDAFKEVLKAAFATSSPYKENAGTPQSFMKQMPVSAWEKMGLQIGGGGGQNYQQQTATATKKSADLLDKLHKAVTSGKVHFGITKGMGAGA